MCSTRRSTAAGTSSSREELRRPVVRPVWLKDARRHRSLVVLRHRRQGIRANNGPPEGSAAATKAHRAIWIQEFDVDGRQARRTSQGARQRRRRFLEETHLDRRSASLSTQRAGITSCAPKAAPARSIPKSCCAHVRHGDRSCLTPATRSSRSGISRRTRAESRSPTAGHARSRAKAPTEAGGPCSSPRARTMAITTTPGARRSCCRSRGGRMAVILAKGKPIPYVGAGPAFMKRGPSQAPHERQLHVARRVRAPRTEPAWLSRARARRTLGGPAREPGRSRFIRWPEALRRLKNPSFLARRQQHLRSTPARR